MGWLNRTEWNKNFDFIKYLLKLVSKQMKMFASAKPRTERPIE